MSHLVPYEMRHHFTRKGLMKRQYSPAKATMKATRYGQEAYECPTCGYWHLASKKHPTRGARRG